jgi:hypothetical protein
LHNREGYNEGFNPTLGAIRDLAAKEVFAVIVQRSYPLVYAGGVLVAAIKNSGVYGVENRERLVDTGLWYEQVSCSIRLTQFLRD